MAIHGNIIYDPISVSDVRATLGASSTDVGSLCRHDGINMWAKYKPIRFPSVERPTLAQRTELSFGIVFPYAYETSVLTADDIYSAAQGSYYYERPSGGANSPYRLGDFTRYDHNAVAPMYTEDLPDDGYELTIDDGFVSVLFWVNGDSETSVNIKNLTAMGIDKAYVGVAIADANTGRMIRYHLSDYRLNDGYSEVSISIPFQGLGIGLYELYFALAVQDERTEKWKLYPMPMSRDISDGIRLNIKDSTPETDGLVIDQPDTSNMYLSADGYNWMPLSLFADDVPGVNYRYNGGNSIDLRLKVRNTAYQTRAVRQGSVFAWIENPDTRDYEMVGCHVLHGSGAEATADNPIYINYDKTEYVYVRIYRSAYNFIKEKEWDGRMLALNIAFEETGRIMYGTDINLYAYGGVNEIVKI